MEDVVSVQPCADASLPRPGHGFRVGLRDGRGHFFVARGEAEREGWVDALTLVCALVRNGRGDALRRELANAGRPP
jgi:hypothetical protein